MADPHGAHSEADPARTVLEACRRAGFALAGVAPASPTDYAEELRYWLGAGKHGEMHYLEKHLEARLDPERILEGARSVICVADRHVDRAPTDRLPSERRFRGRIARYARGDDYHRVIKKRLHALADELGAQFPDQRFRACVDTAPLLEREYAARAGLGAIGKHTLLIERGVTSYLLLGELLTTLELHGTGPATRIDPCATCSRCIEACPTDAITPWSVDATRCISYLTIEHRSIIDESFHEPIGDWLFGCDICQEVCPHNRPTRRTKAAARHGAYAPRTDSFDLLEILNWSEDDRRAALARSAVKRAKLNMLKRNALIVAANALGNGNDDTDHAQLRARIHELSEDQSEDALVRHTARQIRNRLQV